MNKVYKSIWNAVTRSWTAVSEITKSRTKSSKSALIKNTILFLLSGTLIGPANAVWWSVGNPINLDQSKDDGVPNVNFAFGTGEAAKNYDDNIYVSDGADYSFRFNDDGVANSFQLNLEDATISLFDQSQGYGQILISANDISSIWGASFSVNNADTDSIPGSSADSNRLIQQIRQDNTDKATAVYVIGKRAYKLDESYWSSLGYSDMGILLSDNSFYTASILTGLHLGSNAGTGTEVLDLTVSGNQIWSATLSGNGGISYTGSNRTNDCVEIVLSRFQSQDTQDETSGPNTYTGETNATNVTLNLNRENSLGQTSKLTATNSIINVTGSTAWSSVKALGYNNTDTTFSANQTSFVITNADTDEATFVRTNNISTSSQNFEYQVEGDAQIGTSDSTLSTITFHPTGTVNFEVENNLTVYANSVVAGATNVRVGNALTLYNLDGIREASSLAIGSSLIFNDIEGGVFSHDAVHTNTGLFAVTLNHSQFEYAEDLKLSVSDTTLSNSSTLTVTGTSQLGSFVAFNNGGEDLSRYNKLTINYTDDLSGTDDSTWTLGDVQFTSDNEYAVVEAKGTIDSTLVFTIPNASKWTGYTGWLRISDTTFNLDGKLDDSIFNDGHVGLSVGSGGQVNVTDRIVEIDRFGWSTESDTSGVLDLTRVQPSGDNSKSPVLDVNELRMEGSGTIRLDPTDYLAAGSALTGGSVLDYQDGDDTNRFWIIKAAKVTGGAIEKVYLDRTTGDATSTTQDLFNSNKQLAAQGIWDYETELVTKGEGQKGVYLTYALTELQLVGANDQDKALEINLAQSEERDLHIKVRGAGIMKIDANGDSDASIELSNANNTFSGLVEAGEGVKLTATAGALGTGGAALRLDDGASLTFGDSKSEVTQKLNGLALGTGSSINLGNNTTLELNLNSDYLNSVAPVTTAEIGTNQLLGSGGLTLTAGTLSFTDTSDLFANDGYQGALTVTQGAMMAFSDSNSDSYTLKELHGGGTAILNGQVILGDLSGFSGDLKLESGTQVEFDANTKLSDSDSIVLYGFSDANDTSVRFNAFTTDANQVIDQSVSFGSNIDKFSFNNTKGVFTTDRELSLTLDGDSTIIRNRDELDRATIGESSELLYNIKNASPSYDLTNTSGSGTLTLAFENQNENLSISDTGSGFSGTFRFDNAVLEVGENHTADANNKLATNNSLYVGDGSTLVLNGKQTLGKALTLGSGSSLDFTANSDSYVMEGTSVNAVNMDGNTINLGVGENVQVSVEVDTSVAIKEADTSGTLMEAVRDQDRDGLSLVLIDNIGGDGVAKDLANHMQLVGTDSNQSATVTYQNADGESIADITTGIGLAGVGDQIGLTYDEVTTVAIYDGQTAVFEATGEGDVISAQITNKEGGTGSVHYTGEGAVTLTNSDNNYTGSTTIDGQVSVVADANNALGHSSKLTVGTDSRGSLQVNADQEHLGGLVVNTTGSLTIAEGKVMTLNDSADNVIEGNLDGKGTIRLVKSDLTYTTDVEKVLSVAFETDADSTLTKDGIGKLDFEQTLSNLNLNLAQGGIVLDNGDSLGKFAVVEGTEVDVNGLVNIAELTGTGATFNMAVAFGEGSQEELTDGRAGLHIGTGSGDHFLKVSSKDLNKGAEESIKIVQIDQGDATFALANGLEAVTSGAFDYTLVKQAQDDATSYFLDSTSGSGTDTDSDADAEKVRNTTVTAGSYIGIAYAAQLFDVSLHDRVGNRDWINPVTGEKHSTSLWMQHTMSHERFRDTTSQLRMRATSNTTMLGGDFVQYTADNGGLAYAGLMGGYSTMDTKSGSIVTGLHSKAETDAWGVGVYGGWKADKDSQTGPYVDGWVMFTHAKSDVSGVDQYVEDIKGQGLSASVEVGWGVPAGTIANDDGSVTQVTFEPHASVTWFGMEFDDLHTDAQDVAFEGKNNVRTRLGARAVISEKGNNRFNAFVEANWVHNTQEYGATISGLTVEQAGARNQAETRLGVDWRITDGLSAWGRVGASFGSNNYSDREGSVGIRYQF